MRSLLIRTAVAVAAACAIGVPASAQDAPPRIPRFAVDVHGIVPLFPSGPELAAAHSLKEAELPGRGLGGDVSVDFYPFTWRAVTFGVGARALVARSHQSPDTVAGQTTTTTATNTNTLRDVTEQFLYLGPHLSLNFGTGSGWSYLSAGVGRSQWSLVPDTETSLPPDEEQLKTLDWGGGARWFAKPHLAFSLDVRIYVISPTTAVGVLPTNPRTNLLVIGAGISLK